MRARHIHKALAQRFYLKEAKLLTKFCWPFGYHAILAVGQVGVSIGNLLARLNRCPLIVFSDEFPSCFGYTRWADREANGLRSASLIAIPDLNRAGQLCKEVPGLETKTFIELLNVPLALKPGLIAPINWHHRLGLPEGTFSPSCAREASATTIRS